ncbi:hypothetical protein QAD02_013958 [Eretmocerus hayati]|uniref:Uncharacterized protein n=1 Tax=Eretmocerus hayati TaxID=131215 RepID=A0ACC2P407_9HYME|nr:hypothetical protein QAD02_013958 [Eretmocerus hayati]
MAHIAKLKRSNVISNHVQGTMWRTKYAAFLSKGDGGFPLGIWYDDFQTGNGMGSAEFEQKLGGVYVRCPALPPHLLSKLYSIFSIVIFYANHRENYGHKCVFCKIIEELKILHEHGIRVVINGEEKTLFLALTQLIGDNLALNCVCGYPPRFTATNYCRCCTATAEECKSLTREVIPLVRTKESYEETLRKGKMDESPPPDGIVEECVFNEVPDFHVGDHHWQDVMHDLPEGVCNYTVGNVLQDIIFKQGKLTLDDLNKRIEDFDYGPHETNKPRKARLQKCKDAKNRGKTGKIRLRQSSSEMLCLTRYLSLMIGDVVDEDTESWQLYLKLRQIGDIVTAPRITVDDAEVLKDLVSEHNALYKKLFGHLKPKMHFMTHYPRLLLLNGPLINSWGMPFERKNKELKEVAEAVRNNRNRPHTLAINAQLNMCYMKEFSDGIDGDYQRGPLLSDDVDPDISILFREKRQNDQQIRELKYVEILGKEYSKGTYFGADTRGVDDPYFGEVQGVYDISGDIYVMASIVRTLYFDQKRHAYRIPHVILGRRIFAINEVPRIDPMLRARERENGNLASRYGF